MTYLTEADQEVKDVGVVVDHSPCLNKRAELRLTLCVQRLIVVLLSLIELVLSQDHSPATYLLLCFCKSHCFKAGPCPARK